MKVNQVVILFMISLYFSGCMNMDCESEILSRKCNPEKEIQVIYRSTDCGATTSTSYSIRMVENCHEDEEGKTENTIIGCEKPMKYSWLNKDTLVVFNADTTYGHVMKQEIKLTNQSESIKIIYKWDVGKNDKKDSIWIEFASAIENKDIDFLIKNSMDTIQCVDCISESDKEYFNSKYIFENHIKELMHLESLTDKEFSSSFDGDFIRISYTIKWEKAPEGAYNVIFSFKKVKDKYLFYGMFTVP